MISVLPSNLNTYQGSLGMAERHSRINLCPKRLPSGVRTKVKQGNNNKEGGKVSDLTKATWQAGSRASNRTEIFCKYDH